ncbi:hypothetical protein J1605_021462 [Eschrichtius robustus]|uniref:Uncharacterized protein n=1 Tax=Eschrichtius robustus TaxID=9764 RepID=A0AB34HHL6_ESCRO|nr:hypothetical protein J1605_021462 [Eschrichtius robustus]
MSNLKPDGEHGTSTGTGTGSGSSGTLEEEVGLRPRDLLGEVHAKVGGGRGARGAARDLAIAPCAFPPLPFGRGGAARVRRAGACGLDYPAGRALSPRPPRLGAGSAPAAVSASRGGRAAPCPPHACCPRVLRSPLSAPLAALFRGAPPAWPGLPPRLGGTERD